MSRPRIWQRKFYVHPIQRKYLVLSLVPLILCSFAILALAVLPTHLLLLRGSASDPAQAWRAGCLASLGRGLWPAIFLTMLVVAGLSVLASHTLAGPLYRLEAIGKRLAAGELPETIRIREGDDLREMAAYLDEAVTAFRGALLRIQDHGGQARDRLRRLEQELASGRVPPGMLAPHLVEIGAHLAEIQAAAGAFQLGQSREKPA